MEATEEQQTIISPDGARRAVISQRRDGTFTITMERKVVGDGLHEPKFYWSAEPTGPSIVESHFKAVATANAELKISVAFDDEE